jgi:asparagine synthase (glutamine-hydrolysing)
MMHSLEVRAPFLDIELVDFVRRIPACYKYRFGRTKYIFKKTMERFLPKEILYRSKKGFGMPIGKWFRDGFLKMKSSGIISPEFIARACQEHRAKRNDHRLFLWSAWVLEQNRQAGDKGS